MHTFRRTVAGAAVVTLLLLDAAFPGPADAAVSCGSTIVTNTTLDSDVGPVPAPA